LFNKGKGSQDVQVPGEMDHEPALTGNLAQGATMRTKPTKLFLAVLVLMTVCGWGLPLNGQARFQTKASGLWNASATWVLTSGSSVTGYPGATDTADIVSGHTVTVSGTTVDCATLTVRSGGILSISGSGNVRVNGASGSAVISGTVQMSSTGTLRGSGSGTRSLVLTSSGKITIAGTSGAPSFTTYSLDPQSTFEYAATADQNVLSGIVYGNLTLSGSGKKTVTPIPADSAFRSVGKLFIASGVTFDVSTNILRVYFMGDVENHGTLDASVGIVLLWMTGSQWLNYGTFLPSTTSGLGYTPETHFSNTSIGGSPVSQTFYDLIVDGPITALSNITVTRHVMITPTGAFCAGSGLAHTVGGNWTNNGSFMCGSSSVTFNGKSSQTIGASAFYQIVVDDTAGVSLAGNVSILDGGSFTFTRGNLNTGANSLSIMSSSVSALNLGANRIIGTVTRAIAAGSASAYQFFDANSYIIPNGDGNPTSITATVHPNTNPPNLPPQADTSLVAKRYVTTSAAGAGPNFAYTLRFSYNKTEVRGQELRYVLWTNIGAGWLDVGAATVDTAAHFVQQNGLTGFGDVTAADPAGALPIQLTSFVAATVPNSAEVRLAWTTATEINNYGFFVERSLSGITGFVDLPNNFVLGNGTTLVPQRYEWLDRNVARGTYYYRLRQVDRDGSFKIYAPVKVEVGSQPGTDNSQGPSSFALEQNWPNPFNPTTTINFQIPASSNVCLKVYDVIGREVATLVDDVRPAGAYSVTFDGSGLASGTYVYRIQAGSSVATKKLVLVR
jgi:hypothetical protein